MDILESSKERKRALKAELANVRRTAKRLKEKESTQRSASERAWLIEGAKLNLILTIYVLADCSHEPAVSYLRSLGRQHRWPSKSDTAMIALVEEMFLAADINQLLLLSSWDSHGDSCVLRVATDYVWQWRLANWTTLQNNKGIALPTPLVLDEWAKGRMAVPLKSRPSHWGNATSASARMRVLRWRRKFGGRMGTIRACEHTPVNVMRDKA